MKKGTHGKDEKKFSELDYAGQSKSMNAQLLVFERAMKSHFKKGESEGKNVSESKEKYGLRLQKLIEGLNNY